MNREEFFAKTGEVYEDESPIYGTIRYTRARLKDKSFARRRAMMPTENGQKELDSERLDAALVVTCCVEPKFEPTDIEMLLDNGDAGEISRIASLIVGVKPPKSTKSL